MFENQYRLTSEIKEKPKWTTQRSESSGIIDLARFGTVTETNNTSVAKVVVKSSTERIKEVSFGFSDDVTVYLNDKAILEKYGVTFLKESDGFLRPDAYDYNLSNMMWIYRHPDSVLRFVHTIDLVLAGRYSEIENEDWSADNRAWYVVAVIYPDKKLLLYDGNRPEDKEEYPLEDIWEVFYAWYEFLIKANSNL